MEPGWKGIPNGIEERILSKYASEGLTEFRNDCVECLNEYFGILCDNHHHEVLTAWAM